MHMEGNRTTSVPDEGPRRTLSSCEAARDRPDYALGHSEEELDRLSLQAGMLEPFTRALFADAGIGPGMRVLDVGCGGGDVSLLAAEIVGPRGEVVGIDKAEAAVERARSRARSRNLSHVTFLLHDIANHAELDFDRPFDAIVGRFVLGHLPDPVDVLCWLSRFVRPGGVIAFQDTDLAGARSLPEGPLAARCLQWLGAALDAAGIDTRMGMKLHHVFLAAGLPAPSLCLGGLMGAGPSFVGYAWLATTLQSLLPVMERFGIATAREVDVDTLADRLSREFAENIGVMVIPESIGAWSRLPA